MNPLPKLTRHWNWPTWWQWLVIAWLIALNAVPYAIAFWASDRFGRLDYLLWSMLSGPYSLIGIFGFLTVAGAWPVMARRVLFVTALLIAVGMVMAIVEVELALSGAWFLLEAIVLVTLTLLSCRVLGIPTPPSRWSLQFTLAEIVVLSGLVGVYFFMVRLAGGIESLFWQDRIFLALTAYGFASGIFLVPICLTTIATSLRGTILWLAVSTLSWVIVPVGFCFTFEGFTAFETGDWRFLLLLSGTMGIQALIVWGTLVPLRFAFPHVLFAKEGSPATAAQCKSDTLAASPTSCPQSEHTDVPR